MSSTLLVTVREVAINGAGRLERGERKHEETGDENRASHLFLPSCLNSLILTAFHGLRSRPFRKGLQTCCIIFKESAA